MTALLDRSAADAVRLDADVIIIGAGFAGLGIAQQLKAKSRKTSFLIIERASEVGGTWRDNIYPGCACDIPAMLYSFSFRASTKWTRIYPQQAEILAYLKRTVQRAKVTDRIRFNSEVTQMRFDDATATWTVTLRDGTTLRSRIVISAMGPLNKPKFPAIPGRETFVGPAFHSSQWEYSVDLTGKKVIVVGTGASAIQFVPQIAPLVEQLTIFQRTPPWIIPRLDKPVSGARRLARTVVPAYSWLIRKVIYWTLEFRALGFVKNPKLLERREELVLGFLRRSIKDPVLREKLTPAYRAGCKRMLISDDYYPALTRPNVELNTEGLTEIRPHSVMTAGGREIPADVIIYGTGFNATDGLAPIEVYGAGGVTLADAWRDGMRAYLGTSVAGFPNLFFVIGPNTGLGHNSMVFMMEAQYRYILSAIDFLKRGKRHAIDVRPDAEYTYNLHLQSRMTGTVWATGCSSWYQDARGKNVSLWPGFTFAFRQLTARFDPRQYRVS